MRNSIPLFVAAVLLVSPVADARADMLVGIAGPMTGADAAYGEEIRLGATKAIDDLNTGGGLLGQTLQAAIGDDACDPTRAVAVANELVAKKVAVVIGHVCSAASIPASEIYNSASIVEISPSTTNPQFTERGLDKVFRVCGRDDEQGPAAADYLALAYKGKKRIAVVDDGQTYGKGLAQAFKAAIEAKGIAPVAYEEIDPGQSDYGDLVKHLKSLDVQFVYYGGYYPEAGLIARQLHEIGLKAVLIGGDGLNDPKFWTIAGDAGDGTLMTFGADPKLDPENAELVKYFGEKSYRPEGYTFYAYAAVQVWAEAVRRTQSWAGNAVASGLRTYRFQSVIGTLKFNGKGDRAGRSFAVYVWHAGQPVYVNRQ
jgi:branched-chain amino acid transport system substrate-binding protein